MALVRASAAREQVSIAGAATWSADEGEQGRDSAFTVELRSGRLVLVRPDGQNVLLGQHLQVAPRPSERLLVDEEPYPGSIALTSCDAGLQITNVVDVEEYVEGLLPSQVFDSAGQEAVKAQAIVLRTWVVRQLPSRGGPGCRYAAEGFDFCTDPACCRAYRPSAVGTRVASAVRDTRGQVLTYEGEPIKACFDANAGGRTEAVDSAWPGSAPRDYPYLCSVDSATDQDGAGTTGPYSACWRWSGLRVRASDVAERLERKLGQGVGKLTKLIVRSRSDSGRVRELEVVGTGGRRLVVGSDLIRLILGVPSALLDADLQQIPATDGVFTLSGRGQGSGVGLSQHGAMGMALAGSRCDEILGHYYPGVSLTEDLGSGESRELSPQAPDPWEGQLSFAPDQRLIRVGLCFGPGAVDECTVAGTGAWESGGDEQAFSGEVRVEASGEGFAMESGQTRREVDGPIAFHPTAQPWLELRTSQGSRRYRGVLHIERDGARIRIINELPFEDYVRGVIPNEIFSLGGSEVFKVQAVVSRTFALYRLQQHDTNVHPEGIDICATGLDCQEYHGYLSESSWANEAVRDTQGQVLTQNGQVIMAAYHDNAGGQTDTPYGVGWTPDPQSFPYLRSVQSPEDSAGLLLRGYEWCYSWDPQTHPWAAGYPDTTTLTAEELRARISQYYEHDIGLVQDLVPREWSESGRISALEVIGENGTETLRGADVDVRKILRTPSAMITHIQKADGMFLFTGRGRAHGVGLSQHGAMGLALECWNYDRILEYYYQGVQITPGYAGHGRDGGPGSVIARPPGSSIAITSSAGR